MTGFRKFKAKAGFLLWIATTCFAFGAGRLTTRHDVGQIQPSHSDVETKASFASNIADIDLSYDFKYLPQVVSDEAPMVYSFTYPMNR